MFYIVNSTGQYLNKYPRNSEEERPVPNEPQSTYRFVNKEDKPAHSIWNMDTIMEILDNDYLGEISIIYAKYNPEKGYEETMHEFQYQKPGFKTGISSEEGVFCPHCSEENFGDDDCPESFFQEGCYRQEMTCEHCKKPFYVTRETTIIYYTESI